MGIDYSRWGLHKMPFATSANLIRYLTDVWSQEGATDAKGVLCKSLKPGMADNGPERYNNTLFSKP